jgi:hypothetical protein
MRTGKVWQIAGTDWVTSSGSCGKAQLQLIRGIGSGVGFNPY